MILALTLVMRELHQSITVIERLPLPKLWLLARMAAAASQKKFD